MFTSPIFAPLLKYQTLSNHQLLFSLTDNCYWAALKKNPLLQFFIHCMFTSFSKNVMFYNTIRYAHGGSVFLFLNLSMILATIYGFVLLPAVSRNKSNVDKYRHKSLMTLRWGRNFFKITRILVATFLVCFLPWFVYF